MPGPIVWAHWGQLGGTLSKPTALGWQMTGAGEEFSSQYWDSPGNVNITVTGGSVDHPTNVPQKMTLHL